MDCAIQSTKPLMLIQSEVLQRHGWTRKLLKRRLGDPDECKARDSDGVTYFLYALSRVEAVEATADFKEALERRAAIERALRTLLKRRVESVGITVTKLPDKAVTARAIDSYNTHVEKIGEGAPATTDSNSAFLQRISVNFIRHRLTQYDVARDEVFAGERNEEAVARLRERVLLEIASIYPTFAEEANRQIHQRRDELRMEPL